MYCNYKLGDGVQKTLDVQYIIMKQCKYMNTGTYILCWEREILPAQICLFLTISSDVKV